MSLPIRGAMGSRMYAAIVWDSRAVVDIGEGTDVEVVELELDIGGAYACWSATATLTMWPVRFRVPTLHIDILNLASAQQEKG
jgi:hypothetical protein